MGYGIAVSRFVVRSVEMMRETTMTIMLLLAFTLSGCNGDCMRPKTEEVRNLFNRQLKVGDTREKVDEVLKKAGIGYSYDRFENRYQSTVYDSQCGPNQAASIYVYFDASNEITEVEVRETYTSW